MKSIFVSSTFRDMHEERDIIHERVLPELNEYALQYGESVSFCDLRWGVNTENLESEEGARKVLEVCFDEIDRCKPYMLVILGERYGWIPEKELVWEMVGERKGIMLEDLEKSVTALEIEYGALKNREQLNHTLFYFREFTGAIPEGYGWEDELHKSKLSELKARIQKLAGKNIHTYTVSWDREKHAIKGIEQFAVQVTEDVKRLMETEWKAYAALTPYEKDRRFQWDFAKQKAEQFRARENLIDEYTEKLNCGQRLLMVSGPAGCGKSTIIARLAVKFLEEGKEVLPVFCGSTLFCNSAMAVLRYIVRYIEDQLSLEHFEKTINNRNVLKIDGTSWYDHDKERRNDKRDFELWVDRLEELCTWYTDSAGKDLIILIDAVDQLFADEIRERLCFIPTNLSNKVKMVCSFLDTFHPRYHSELKKTESIRFLDEKEKRKVVEGILSSMRRELALPVIDKIIRKRCSASPLYLNLIMQRLVMMDRNDFEIIAKQGDGINAIRVQQSEVVDSIPEDLEDLCLNIVHVASGKLGGNLVEMAVQYIAISRYGLREKDLEGILASNRITWNSLEFMLFIRYMKSFFMIRDDGRWDFTHSSIREGIRKHCEDTKKLHREILEYLKRLDKSDEVRVKEIVYHCCEADDREYFVRYISKYKNLRDTDILIPTAKSVYEMCMRDDGEWLYTTIENGKGYIDHEFLSFIIFDLSERLEGSEKDFRIGYRVLYAICLLADMRAKSAESPRSLIESYYDLGFCFDKCGEIFEKHGGQEALKAAYWLYEKSILISEAFVKSAEKFLTPEIRDWCDAVKHNLGVNYHQMARVYEKQGGEENLCKAKELYRKSLRISESLDKNHPTAEYKYSLGVSYNDMARIYEKQGGKENLERAKKLYEKSLEIFEEIVVKQRTIKSQRALDVTYGELGYIYEKLGEKENLRKAQAMYEKSLEISEYLVKKQRTDENRRNLGICYARLGQIYLKLNVQEEAQVLLEKSLAIFEELSVERCTVESRQDLETIYERLAGVYEGKEGEESQKKAETMYKKSLEIQEILTKEQCTTENQRELILSYNKIGEMYERSGGNKNIKKAQVMYEKALQIAAGLIDKEKSVQSYDDLAVFLYKVACHPMTSFDTKRKYLDYMLYISEMLYQNTSDLRYKQFIDEIKTKL